MPIGCSLMKWPPGLLCASRAVSGRLGLWSLRLTGSSAELEPLDEFSQSFDCECSHAAWRSRSRDFGLWSFLKTLIVGGNLLE